MTAKTRVFLADDHPIVLNGLRNLLRTERDIDLVGEASDGLAA
jgi:DNA-binding NarL/FixJ family response regulator